MNVAIVGAKHHIGERVVTIKGYGTIEYIDGDDESIFYHVKLDNGHGSYIFGDSQVFELVKKELGI